MFTWTKQSTAWMESAAEYTGYYERIAENMLNYLKPEDEVLEIACGTGHLAAALATQVKSVTAIDISEIAIDFFKSSLKKSALKNVTPLLGDWKELCLKDLNFDAVVFSYFGAFFEDISLLRSFSPRLIAAALPYYKPRSRYAKTSSHGHRKETVESVCEFLEESHLEYKLLDRSLEFGQPLSNAEDALAYMSYYFPNFSNEENREFLKKNLVPLRASSCNDSTLEKSNSFSFDSGGCDAFYLPKQKRVGIFILPV